MQPARVNVYIAVFAYGGNGGLAMVAPELAIWMMKTWLEMDKDPRIANKGVKVYSDTPITMTRNRAVRDAKNAGFDIVLMLDSDNQPDGYLNQGAAPFWKTAFDFAYDRLVKGIPTVVAAPYCGPPPDPTEKEILYSVGEMTYEKVYSGEVPYLFQWSNNESDNSEANMRLDILTRNEAARLSGIYPMAALPTGVCLFTLSAFDGLPQPYFRYEINEDGSEKKSTEDVVATRDISLFWKMKKGWDVLYATCDSWALHHKTKKVGRPQFIPVESVAETFRDALAKNQSQFEAKKHFDYSGQLEGLKRRHEVLGPDDECVVITEEDQRIAKALLDQESRPERPNGDIAAEEQHAQGDSDQRADSSAGEADTKLNHLIASSRINLPVQEEDPRAQHEKEDEQRPDTDTTHSVDPDYVKSNGKALTHKMVSGKKVAIVGDFNVPELSLEAVAGLASWVVSQRGEVPIEAAVIHSGTGQSAAAILAALPDGSHLHALDSTIPYQFSKAPAEYFNKTFAREIETGRVMADNLERKMPGENENQSLDFVFIEQFLNENKLRRWYKAVAPGGVLAGLGFENPKLAKIMREFVASYGFTMQESGDVWAIKVGVFAEQDTE